MIETTRKNDNVPAIYCIHNILNNKRYIGSSKQVHIRLTEHYRKLSISTHVNNHLKDAVNLDGIDNFRFYVLEKCKIEELLIKEQFWVDLYNTANRDFGYNKAKKIERNSGWQWSEERRKEVSEKKKGTQLHPNALKHSRMANIKKIYQYDLNNNFIKEWDSTNEAASALKIDQASICKVIKGVKSHNSAGGFLWKSLKTDVVLNSLKSWKGRPIICNETGIIYTNLQECAEKTGFTYAALSKALDKNVKVGYKFTFNKYKGVLK